MKKSVVIAIGIIFIASIFVINFFGMKVAVYNQIIPITSIDCTNVDNVDRGISVEESEGKKLIKVKFEGSANSESLTGTLLQLEHRVYPDNASNKNIRYVYTKRNNFEFVRDESGRETGLILFYGKALFDVQIMSEDGRKISTLVTIWAY